VCPCSEWATGRVQRAPFLFHFFLERSKRCRLLEYLRLNRRAQRAVSLGSSLNVIKSTAGKWPVIGCDVCKHCANRSNPRYWLPRCRHLTRRTSKIAAVSGSAFDLAKASPGAVTPGCRSRAHASIALPRRGLRRFGWCPEDLRRFDL